MPNPILRTKRFSEIVKDMKLFIVGGDVGLTNYNPGGRNITLIEAIAIKLEEMYFKVYFAIQQAIVTSAYEGFDFTRMGAEKSSGQLQFSRITPAGSDITIPIGTIGKTSDGVQFQTTSVGTILTGFTISAPIPAQASLAGTSGNVVTGSVNILVSTVPGIEAIINPSAFTGGADEETDDQRQQRFRTYVNSLARVTPLGLKGGALGVSGVKSATVVENDPAPGFIKVFIDDGSGSATAALITQVQFVLDGSDPVTNPGYRGVGTVVTVLAPILDLVNVTATLVIDSIANADSVRQETIAAVQNYINSLGVGDDVIFNKLIDVIMNVTYVLDLNITVPAANVPVAAGHVARSGTINIV